MGLYPSSYYSFEYFNFDSLEELHDLAKYADGLKLVETEKMDIVILPPPV